MKKTANSALSILAAAGAAAAVTGFLVAPARIKPEKVKPFIGRNYAHRGLHKQDKSVPENSLTAFTDAAENGYGIELDVRLTSDNRVVVFHDRGLERICGAKGEVGRKDWSHLKNLKLAGTKETIPLLSEALSAIGARVPVIIELKHARRDRELCERTMDLLRCYSGLVCVQSFNPFILSWFRQNAPEIPRSQLSCPAKLLHGKANPIAAFLVSRALSNFISRPHFFAWGGGKKPLTVKLCEALGAKKVSWTALDMSEEAGNDAVIFEFCIPVSKYK